MVFIRVMKHSESGKSAFVKVTRKLGPFKSEVGIGYLYLDGDDPEAELPELDTEFNYPGEVGFENMIDTKTGELRTTKNGEVLQRVVLK